MTKIRSVILSVLVIVLLPVNNANADQYANATEARDAAVKAMKDFQQASFNCKDLANLKNSLTALEVSGIKTILERSKTLLSDCEVPGIFSEQSIKQLTADNGVAPANSISDYSDYVMEFEAYSNSIEAVADDINTALPSLKNMGKLIAERQIEISAFEKSIQKFDLAFSNFSTMTKELISLNPIWNSYQTLMTSLIVEKESYVKALAKIDELVRLIDVESTLDEVNTILSVKLPQADLDKYISDLSAIASSNSNSISKSSSSAGSKSTTITCTKGKIIKKITAINPKCPAGYKKK